MLLNHFLNFEYFTNGMFLFHVKRQWQVQDRGKRGAAGSAALQICIYPKNKNKNRDVRYYRLIKVLKKIISENIGIGKKNDFF